MQCTCACPQTRSSPPSPPASQMDALRPEFRQGLELFTTAVMERAKPKAVGDTVMTGPILAALTQAYIDSLNGGSVPTILTSWQVRASREMHRCDLTRSKRVAVFVRESITTFLQLARQRTLTCPSRVTLLLPCPPLCCGRRVWKSLSAAARWMLHWRSTTGRLAAQMPPSM